MKLTRAHAFRLYVELGDTRSIAKLTALLKKAGHKISRNTLGEWANEEHWNERLDTLAPEESAQDQTFRQSAVVLRLSEHRQPANARTIANLRDTPDRLAALATDLAASVSEHLGAVQAATVSDLVALAGAAANVAQAAANIQKLIAETGTFDGKVIEGEASGDTNEVWNRKVFMETLGKAH